MEDKEPICSVEKCNLEVHSESKCILHCDKTKWYTEENILIEKNKAKEFYRIFEETYKNKKDKHIDLEFIHFPTEMEYNHLTNSLINIAPQSVLFFHCTFYNGLTIIADPKHKILPLRISLDSSTVLSGNCALFNLEIKNLKITNSTIESDFAIHNSKIKNIKIKYDSTINNIKIKKVDFEGDFTIYDSTINNIKIKKVDFKGDFKIHNSTIESDFAIHNSTINNIKIKKVDFEGLSEFNKVNFGGVIKFSEIIYKGLALFDKCTFNAKANFKYVSFKELTTFRKSTFNEGLNLDFTGFSSEVNFFGIKGLDKQGSKEKTTQETYRIIKYNFEKVGNKIEANKYHSMELSKREEELAGKFSNINLICKSEKQSLSNFEEFLSFFVYFFHGISSSYSRDYLVVALWILSVSMYTNLLYCYPNEIAWALLLHLAFFLIFLLLYSWGKMQPKYARYGAVILSIVYAFYLYKSNSVILISPDTLQFASILNPNILKEDTEDTSFSIILFINKILLGYLYYQFITAVRRDTSK